MSGNGIVRLAVVRSGIVMSYPAFLFLHNHTIAHRHPTRPIPWHLYANCAGLYVDHLACSSVRLSSSSICLHRNADNHARLYCALCHSINLHRDSRRDRHGIQLLSPSTHATSCDHGGYSPCGDTPNRDACHTCGTGHHLSTDATCAGYTIGRW